MSVSRKMVYLLDAAGFLTMHLACLSVFWIDWGLFEVMLCLVSYLVRMFAITAGVHRYFSHRSYRTSRWFQFVLALLASLALQKGILWWAGMHRHHHRHADTDLDYHSPQTRSLFHSHIGWFLDPETRNADLSRVADFADFPELVWLDRWNIIPAALYGLAMFGLFGLSGFIWGFCISTVLMWHAALSTGSIQHRWGGYRRFDTPDSSRNHWMLSLLLLGEGWHNNHHFAPSSAKHGFAWWEPDPNYWILCTLEKLGVVWDLRPVPGTVQRSLKSACQASD